MGRKHHQYDYWLYVLLSGLGVWLTLAAGGLAWLDPDTALLGCVLLALTTVVAVTGLFPYAGWAVAGASSILYASLQMSLLGPTVSALTNASVGAVGLMGTALFSSVIARQLTRLVDQVERDRRLIYELTVHDPKTGLMKLRYARQALRSEIARSRRYHSNLSLITMQVANWDEVVGRYGGTSADALMDEVVSVVADSLRVVDTPFTRNARTIGVILPEIPPEGAQAVAQRLIDTVANRVRVALHIGITHFPDDAVTWDELLRAAEAALEFGLTSGQPIVCYTQLRSAVDGEEGEAILEPRMEPAYEYADPQRRDQEVSATVHPQGFLNP